MHSQASHPGELPSAAARARAVRRGPGLWGFLLAHHWPGHLGHCYLVWIRGSPVWFCARCAGTYPALLAAVALQLWLGVPMGWWDIPWMFLLPLPALVDWGTTRFEMRTGSNLGRTITGALLGVSLGRTVVVNVVSPAHTLVVAQLVGLTLIAALVEAGRRWRPNAGAEP